MCDDFSVVIEQTAAQAVPVQNLPSHFMVAYWIK
jgi:hypothetical protein